MNKIAEIRNLLREEELPTQLAEECAELSKAALKLRRAITQINPTPATKEDAQDKLIEEACDVLLILKCLQIDTDGEFCKDIQDSKTERWLKRLTER